MTSVVTMTVAVPVTTLWVDPDSPRAVDAAMLRQRPDSAQWLAALDAHADEGPEGVGAGRLGLHLSLIHISSSPSPLPVSLKRPISSATSFCARLAACVVMTDSMQPGG